MSAVSCSKICTSWSGFGTMSNNILRAPVVSFGKASVVAQSVVGYISDLPTLVLAVAAPFVYRQ